MHPEHDKLSEYQNIAEALYKDGQYEEALRQIDKCLLIDPKHLVLLRLKASALAILRRYQESIDFTKTLLHNDPNDSFLWYIQGLSLLFLGQYKASISAFDECLKRDPNYIKATIKKISALVAVGEYQQAVNLFTGSDLPLENRASMLNNIGFSLIKLGQFTRALQYLQEAVQVDKSIPQIYLNLSKANYGLKNYRVALYFYLRCKALSLLKNIIKRKDNAFRSNGLFSGPGRLFAADSQDRELMAIFKLFNSPNIFALCSDWFQWFAINIPLNLIGDNAFEGDIDLLISMPREISPQDTGGSRYRAFEIKSIILSKSGEIKSLGRGKHRKIVSQLKKLKNFGCEQIYLLEIYIAERGYSSTGQTLHPDALIDLVKKKQFLATQGFGYVTLIDEPSEQYLDSGGGVAHIPQNILSATRNVASPPFFDLAEYLDRFYKENVGDRPGFNAIVYCKKCKKLFIMNIVQRSFGDLRCDICREKII